MTAMQVLSASCLRKWATPRSCLLGSAGLRSDLQTLRESGQRCKFFEPRAALRFEPSLPAAQVTEQKKLGPQSLRKQKKAHICGKNLPSKNLRGNAMCQHSLIVCGS